MNSTCEYVKHQEHQYNEESGYTANIHQLPQAAERMQLYIDVG